MMVRFDQGDYYDKILFTFFIYCPLESEDSNQQNDAIIGSWTFVSESDMICMMIGNLNQVFL